MTGRRIVTSLALLCALVSCAFAASASAAGTTYFECVSSGSGFFDADCSEQTGIGFFGHKAVTAKTLELASITQSSAKSKLMGTIGGITTTIEATGFSDIGASIQNSERESKEMAATGKGKGLYTGAFVAEGPAGCEIKGFPNQLETESVSVPASMEIELKPAFLATNLAEFTFEKCVTKALNTTYKVSGTARGFPKGALLEFTEASTKNLKFAGQTAFLIGTYTVSLEASGNPLALTTTTP